MDIEESLFLKYQGKQKNRPRHGGVSEVKSKLQKGELLLVRAIEISLDLVSLSFFSQLFSLKFYVMWQAGEYAVVLNYRQLWQQNIQLCIQHSWKKNALWKQTKRTLETKVHCHRLWLWALILALWDHWQNPENEFKDKSL